MVSYLYCITNNINQKQYIGKANDPQDRWKKHIYSARVGPSLAIDYAIKKYGAENFKFEVIGEYETEDIAYLYEAVEIKNHESHVSQNGYNVSRGGRGGSKSGFKFSEEARKRISLKRKGMKFSPEHRKNLSKAFKGRKCTIETRAKLSIVRRGERNSQAKLNIEKVREIKKHLLIGDKTRQQLADENDISVSTIKAIKSGKLWAHVVIEIAQRDEKEI